jgi:hypothetical protein
VLAFGEYLFCDVLWVHNVENRKTSFGNRAGFLLISRSGLSIPDERIDHSEDVLFVLLRELGNLFQSIEGLLVQFNVRFAH